MPVGSASWRTAGRGDRGTDGSDIAALLRELLAAVGTGGNLDNDGAYLAAPAIEHRAQIVSQDNDFLRFPGITLETTPGTAHP